jgi:hypothetical protein
LTAWTSVARLVMDTCARRPTRGRGWVIYCRLSESHAESSLWRVSFRMV